MDIKFEIVKNIAVISEGTKGWSKELNLVSWNDREPRLDIRDWSSDHTKCGKGITLDDADAESLCMALSSYFGYSGSEDDAPKEEPKPEPKKEEPKKETPKKETPKKKELSGEELLKARREYFDDEVTYDTIVGQMDMGDFLQVVTMLEGNIHTYRVHGNIGTFELETK